MILFTFAVVLGDRRGWEIAWEVGKWREPIAGAHFECRGWEGAGLAELGFTREIRKYAGRPDGCNITYINMHVRRIRGIE